MVLHRHNLSLKTAQPLEIRDITGEVEAFVQSLETPEGLLVVASPHTTLGVAVNERCEELQKDMIEFLKRLAPAGEPYRHNRVAVDGRPNAHSHLLSLLIPSQVSLVVAEGRIQKGEWQSIFAIELDGPRAERKIELTLFHSLLGRIGPKINSFFSPSPWERLGVRGDVY
jgi:secondary thiamine-phosphate synthase enzyme